MAIYKYITDEDLKAVVQDIFVKEALGGDLRQIEKMEAIAIQIMRDKLKYRYDCDVIFAPIPQWSSGAAFTTGQYCYDEGVFYKALQGSTNKKPKSNPSDWTPEDPREALVVSSCTDITVYHIFKRINPRKIPDNIKEAYSEAMKWLSEIRDYKEHPELPEVDDELDELPFDGPDELDHSY